MNIRTVTTNYSPYIDTRSTTTAGSFTMEDDWSSAVFTNYTPPWITITTPIAQPETGDALERLRGMRERQAGGLAVAS